jgi:translocation and assembly module TamB
VVVSWKKWLLILGLCAGIVPAIAASLIRTRVVRQYAAREAAAAVRRELGLIARVDEVHLQLTPLQVIATRIRLDHPRSGPVAAAAALRIRPSLRGLLRGQLDLSDITIEYATVWLKIRDGRIENLPELPPLEQAKSEGVKLPFEELHVEHSRLIIDAEPLASSEVRNIEVHLTSEPLGAVRAAISADGGFVRHASGTDVLNHLALLGTFTTHGVALEMLRLQTPQLKLDVRDAELGLPFGKHYRGHVELGLHIPQLANWPHGLALPGLAGELDIKGDVEHDPGGPRGRAQVLIDRGVCKQFGFGRRVALDVRFDPKLVLFNGFSEIEHEGGTVSLMGKIALEEGLPLSVQATVNDVAFARLMGQLGVSNDAIVDWNLRGGFSLSGTAVPLELSGPLRMATTDFKVLKHAWHAPPPERRILGVRSAKLVGNVRVRPDGIHLDDFDIELPNSKLTATTLLGFDNTLKLRAAGIDWNLADASPLVDLPIGGRGRFEVVVEGSFALPKIRGHLRVANFALNTFDFGDLETDMQVDDDLEGVRFPEIHARKNGSVYTVRESFLDFRQAGFRAQGLIDVKSLALADFYRIFHWDGDERYEPYQGTVNGKALLRYSLGHARDSAHGTLIADMELAIPEAVLDGYRFTNGRFSGAWRWLNPDAGYRGGQLHMERLSLRKGSGTVNVSGRMGLGGALDFVVVGDRIATRDTESIHESLPELGGTLALTGSIKGTAPKPRANLELVGSGLSLSGTRLGDGRLYVRLTDKSDPWIAEALRWPQGAPPSAAPCGHAREGLARGQWPEDPPLRTHEGWISRLDQPMAFVLCGEGLGGQLSVDVAVGRTMQTPMRGRVRFRDLDFGKLLPQLRSSAMMQGRASGTLSLTGGTVRSPETLSGQLSLSELRTGPPNLELENKGPIHISIEDGNFEVKSAQLSGPRAQLSVSGGGSFHKGLGLRVDGSMDLGLLPSFAERIAQASGSATLSVNVTGPIAQPAVYGQAWVRGVSLDLAGVPVPVRDLNGKVTFSARRLLLEGFSATVAGGKLQWNGSAALADHGVGSYALQIQADGLTLQPREGIDMRVGGHGELSWKEGENLPLLRGKLSLDQFAYTRPIKMGANLEEIAAPDRRQEANYDPTRDRVKIDLEVEQQRPLIIHNNLIDAELDLQSGGVPFRLVGTDQRLGVLGQMNVRKGTIYFREHTFDIRQGDIHFDDEDRIDPKFDLRATTEVRRNDEQANWRVEIHARGNRDQLQFDLSSEPYLAQDDVALLLAMGMTHAELARLQTSGDLTSTAAQALASLTGVGNQVHRALPQVDDFHVASIYSERTNRTEPQLVIGKRIAKNVRLSAATGIAEARDFRTGVELELDDKTSVQAVYDNQNTTNASQVGDVGFDLKWRLEFD